MVGRICSRWLLGLLGPMRPGVAWSNHLPTQQKNLHNLSPYPLSPDDCQELLNGWLRLLRSGLCGGLWVDLGLTAEPPNKAQAKAQGPHLLDTGSLSPQHHTGLKNLINLARRLFPSVVLG